MMSDKLLERYAVTRSGHSGPKFLYTTDTSGLMGVPPPSSSQLFPPLMLRSLRRKSERSPMSSTAQLLANQANSRLSTGPRTDAGKSASSLNNFHHGARSEAVL